MIEKILVEKINKVEYQKAIRSSIAATANPDYVKQRHNEDISHLPIIVSNDIEAVKNTKEMTKILGNLKLSNDLEKSHKPKIRKGLRRLSNRRHFRKSVLIVVNEDRGIINAARNIPGVDVCTLSKMTAGMLAPGGVPGRITIWGEAAIKNMSTEIPKMQL